MPLTIELADGLEGRLQSMPDAERRAMLHTVLENLNMELMRELDPPNVKIQEIAYEPTPEVMAAFAEVQSIAIRINLRLDSIHNDLQSSITDIREAHETAAAIRHIGEVA